MKILFDQGVPVPLRSELSGHTAATAFEQGWSTLSNGRLLAAAEAAGYDVMITTDKNLKHQQNLADRTVAIMVLPTTRWPIIQLNIEKITDALESIAPGDYRELVW